MNEWEAECKRESCLGLPQEEGFLNWNSHVEDNEPDTSICLKGKDNILSRIYRYYFSNASGDGNSFTSCQKAKRSLSTKGSIEYKQADKTIRTLNITTVQPRDLTASTGNTFQDTRRRSFHRAVAKR